MAGELVRREPADPALWHVGPTRVDDRAHRPEPVNDLLDEDLDFGRVRKVDGPRERCRPVTSQFLLDFGATNLI